MSIPKEGRKRGTWAERSQGANKNKQYDDQLKPNHINSHIEHKVQNTQLKGRDNENGLKVQVNHMLATRSTYQI